MKVVWRLSWISGLVIALAIFLITFIQFPTFNVWRLLGQLAGSVGVGAVVFLIIWGLGALIVRIARRSK